MPSKPSPEEVRERIAHAALLERIARRNRFAKVIDRRRGFSVPDHLAEDYRALRKVYKAREAAILLGILPPTQGVPNARRN